jgi:polyisoprenoid-binding protein YceI
MRIGAALAALSLVIVTPAFAAPTSYTFDPAHSAATFIELDRSNLHASNVEATIDAASVNTREPKRDAHLKSPDFFDVANTKTPFGTTIVGTSATTRINRRDFGVTGGTAGVMVGDDVNITLDLELVKQ